MGEQFVGMTDQERTEKIKTTLDAIEKFETNLVRHREVGVFEAVEIAGMESQLLDLYRELHGLRSTRALFRIEKRTSVEIDAPNMHRAIEELDRTRAVMVEKAGPDLRELAAYAAQHGHDTPSGLLNAREQKEADNARLLHRMWKVSCALQLASGRGGGVSNDCIEFVYTNHRDEIETRRVFVREARLSFTPRDHTYYPSRWVLSGVDERANAVRDFDLMRMERIQPLVVPPF